MKTNYFKMTIMSCVIAAGMISCTSSPQQKAESLENAQEKVVDAKQELEQARIDSTNEYTLFKSQSDAQLKDNELKISNLKAKTSAKSKANRLEYEKKLAELEQKNTQLKVDMLDYQGTDKTEWEKFKLQYNQNMAELKISITDFIKKNKL